MKTKYATKTSMQNILFITDQHFDMKGSHFQFLRNA